MLVYHKKVNSRPTGPVGHYHVKAYWCPNCKDFTLFAELTKKRDYGRVNVYIDYWCSNHTFCNLHIEIKIFGVEDRSKIPDDYLYRPDHSIDIKPPTHEYLITRVKFR